MLSAPSTTSPHLPTSTPAPTINHKATEGSEEDEDEELATRFAAILLFLGLGMWLTHTGRIGHVSWKLGVGITMLVFGVVGVMAFLVDGPNGGK